ncbi:MAG: hypothetical protein BWY59_00048 [Verrucomicrobia bacterium ADurb.Bin345]|nr:MAG: hypothetical protein BWY59_00048 [Verrucomicrobia bacterium ADurb.Bin345]
MRYGKLALVLLLCGFPAYSDPVLLHDFENDTETWSAEWGLTEPLQVKSGRSRSGSKALEVSHRFAPKKETIGFRIVLDPPRDFTMDPGFVGFSAWVYFPSGDGWEAQMYVHSGEAWKWGEGPLQNKLQPGWHRIMISSDRIADPTSIRSIGIQIKNYKQQREMRINVDRVEALYDSPARASKK